MTIQNWRDADPRELEPFYSKWVMALTAEGLHAKSDIAVALAILDRDLSALRKENEALRQGLQFIASMECSEISSAFMQCVLRARALLAKEGEERHE